MNNLIALAKKSRGASTKLRLASSESRSIILEKIAVQLEKETQLIAAANKKDLKMAEKKGLSSGMKDRLLLDEKRLSGSIADLRKVARLEDPVGNILEEKEMPNGLFIRRVRVPIGVIAMIYEARPNVTIDAAALCIKSGNVVILKGGSDALHTNRAIVHAIRAGLKDVSLQDAVQLIESTDRNATLELIGLHGLIDVVIPRGGQGLINFVRKNAKVPVIETGASVVHTYVHSDADINKAVDIILNAKLRRISICNSLDVLIVHERIAKKLLQELVYALPNNEYACDHLQIRADQKSFPLLKAAKDKMKKSFNLGLTKAKSKDFDTEFLDYILAVKVVKNIDEAIQHIETHSLKHSEAIITESATIADRFLSSVDSACVYWNASTQFSDGGQFGLEAEIGISTQKLHVRGPFALEGLTSYKWVVEGTGNIRLP